MRYTCLMYHYIEEPASMKFSVSPDCFRSQMEALKRLGVRSWLPGGNAASSADIPCFITFDDGARLELMNKPGMDDPEKPLNRTGYAHIAFSVGSRERVDELTEALRTAGFAVVSGPRTTGDGYYESCIVAVESNQIEITE